jgi:hypothetical protein
LRELHISLVLFLSGAMVSTILVFLSVNILVVVSQQQSLLGACAYPSLYVVGIIVYFKDLM